MGEIDKKSQSKLISFSLSVIKVTFLGVGIYVVMNILPVFLFKHQSGALNNEQDIVEESTIYKDKNGKVINIHDYNLMVGYDFAEENDITSHAECKSEFLGNENAFKRDGCHKYVTEQKDFPPKYKLGAFDDGTTGAECEAKIKAYWEPRVQDQKEIKGETYAWDGTMDFYDCENYDKIRIGKFLIEPTTRLDAILSRLNAGGMPTTEDKETVFNDMKLVKTNRESYETQSYFNKADKFFMLAYKAESNN